MARKTDAPVVLITWYDFTQWLLERIDSFPKNQRFIFGQRPGGYHYFRICEPKERLVAAAPFRDRVVHHAIVRVILPLFERRFIEDSFASRPGKGTHAAKRRAPQFARRFAYALKCNVQKYSGGP